MWLRPQQGLEVPEGPRPRDCQPPHPHTLPTPQPRARELQAVRGVPRGCLPGREEGVIQQAPGSGVWQQVCSSQHLRTRVPDLSGGVRGLCCPVHSSGSPPLRPRELNPADPGGDRIRGARKRDSEVCQRPDNDPSGLPDEGTLHSTIFAEVEDRGKVVLQLPDRPGVQRGPDAAQPHLRPHLPQHEGHL
jgi:hypothetical protein